MSIIKMSITTGATATTVATASIDVPADGTIRAITLGMSFQDATPAISDALSAELTFLSTPQFLTNDARGSLCQTGFNVAFQDAARLVLQGVPFCVLTPIAVAVAAGERIFLHIQASGADDIDGTATAYLFIDDGLDVGRAQIRRR